MSSKYDSIQTAAELVAEVQNHGLSLAQGDICRAQDIFGHTPIEDMVQLANDIGRNNAKGEPDPKGTWSSGRRATQSTFYSILTNIWHWEEVTRFWNEHTNPQTEKLKELQDLNKRLAETNDALKFRKEGLVAEEDQMSKQIVELKNKVGIAETRAKEAEKEVVRLKAKLYDLMIAEKESA